MTAPQPGWYPDPHAPGSLRWWDGRAWTSSVVPGSSGRAESQPEKSSARRGRQRAWMWLAVLVLGILAAVLLPVLVVPIALAVLVTAVVGLVRGSRTWLRFSSRRTALAVTGMAAVMLLTATGASAVNSTSQTPPAQSARLVASDPLADERQDPPERTGADASPSRGPEPTQTPVTTTREEKVTEVIPFSAETVDDASLPLGESQLKAAGKNGERTLTYRVTSVDGVETSRELVSDVVTIPPVTEVTAKGTYVAPPPPAEPAPVAAPPVEPQAGCDSNYAEACVPIASDVDCAGGSGNGPEYFSGVARVVGSDVYELDRDGDGYACEPW